MPELLSPMDELPFWLHLFLVDELPFLLHWLQLFYGCIVILAPAIFRDELSHLLCGWITIFAPWIFILAPSILWINGHFGSFFFKWILQFWLYLFINDHQFGYITKLKKQNIGYIGESRGSFVSILWERSILRARWVFEVGFQVLMYS